MLTDNRIYKLAEGLVDYSCRVKAGERVLIEATGVDYQLVNALIKKVYERGAYPHVVLHDNRVNRYVLMNMTEAHAKDMARYALARMDEMDAYIGVRGGNNMFELSDVPPEKMQLYNTLYNQPVHTDCRVGKTKWVVLRYPTEGFSLKNSMSTEACEDFYFNVCTLDYSKMSKAMEPLIELLNKTDEVKIIAPGTDLTFSIKDIPAIKCDGQRNIPDGEIFTAPVRNSVNGTITFNAPSIQQGIEFNNVKLTFKDGKIIEATANHTEALNKILDTDEGARYIGEFAFGINPFIKKPVGDLLFDEKISGSIHFTPGNCYESTENGNKSAIHWDLVAIHTEEFGGGEIYFDGVLVRKNGLFVPESLHCLNPENLM